MTNETKVGLLAVVTIALSIIGYNFLKGVNVLNSANLLKSSYKNVSGLTVSSPVIINGLQVGVVKEIYFKDDLQTLEVVMNVEENFRIPKDAEAVITNTGLMGGTAVVLKYKSICNGANCAPNGHELKGRVANPIEAYLGSKEDIAPYLNELQQAIGPITDTIKSRFTDPTAEDGISKSIRDISIVLENLKASTASLNRVMVANSKPLNDVLKNTESITGNFSESNQNIKGIMQNTDSLTANLAELEIEKTLNGANAAIASLQNTMTSADKAVGQLTTMLEKINNGEGAIGKLMTDESSITKLTSMVVKLDSLATDFQERPYRYMPLKSRKRVKKMDKRDAEGK